MRETGEYPCVIGCLTEARSPSTSLLPTNQCVQLQRRCCLLWSQLGQGGNSWDWCRRMGRTNAVSNILPDPPSLFCCWWEQGELFSTQEKPITKSLPIPKLCSSSPLHVMQSAAHTGVPPRDQHFDRRSEWSSVQHPAWQLHTSMQTAHLKPLPSSLFSKNTSSWKSSSSNSGWHNTEPWHGYSRLGLA